ncbi:hypothetical protein A2U01_0075707, partial [Trifolium medium]|nr:hypothetical protein [Trifolium medium]
MFVLLLRNLARGVAFIKDINDQTDLWKMVVRVEEKWSAVKH